MKEAECFILIVFILAMPPKMPQPILPVSCERKVVGNSEESEKDS